MVKGLFVKMRPGRQAGTPGLGMSKSHYTPEPERQEVPIEG